MGTDVTALPPTEAAGNTKSRSRESRPKNTGCKGRTASDRSSSRPFPISTCSGRGLYETPRKRARAMSAALYASLRSSADYWLTCLRTGNPDGVQACLSELQHDACLPGQRIRAPGRCLWLLRERHGSFPGDGPLPGRLTGRGPERSARTGNGLDPGWSYPLGGTCPRRAATGPGRGAVPGTRWLSRAPGRVPQARARRRCRPGLAASAPGPMADRQTFAGRPATISSGAMAPACLGL